VLTVQNCCQDTTDAVGADSGRQGGGSAAPILRDPVGQHAEMDEAAPRSSHSSPPAVGGMEDEGMDLQRTLAASMDELPTGGGGGGSVGAFVPMSEVEGDTSGLVFDYQDDLTSHEDHPTTSISGASVVTSNPVYGGLPVAHGAGNGAIVRELQEFLRDLEDLRTTIAGTARSSGDGSKVDLMFFFPM
jgi:hypothetical protein